MKVTTNYLKNNTNMIYQKDKIREFIRFGIVGGIATFIHYVIYIILNIYINTTVAYSIGYFISFLANYYLSNRYTFRTNPTVKNGIGFGISHIINYFLQVSLLHLFIYFGVKEQYAPIPVYTIAVPINFFLVRFALKKGF